MKAKTIKWKIHGTSIYKDKTYAFLCSDNGGRWVAYNKKVKDNVAWCDGKCMYSGNTPIFKNRTYSSLLPGITNVFLSDNTHKSFVEYTKYLVKNKFIKINKKFETAVTANIGE